MGNSSSRDSSVCRAALGGREGYYALEAGSADETLLLTPSSAKEARRKEGRRRISFQEKHNIGPFFSEIIGGSASRRIGQ